ncbi:MAG: NAD-dependent epimerase/dehydratase family protein [Verrucomicrobiaceae bacterium]|nr:NAD-dependent epimerase/dehydratase family protein [Verrucomicrobiaceae bacterium]
MTAFTHHLVTGAAGFIGSHLIDHLQDLGIRVTGVDSLKLGRAANLATAGQKNSFRLIQADLNDIHAWNDEVSRLHREQPISLVWHMAANSDIQAGVRDARVDLQDTFMTTFHVLDWMRRENVREIAFASSSAIYGPLEGFIGESAGPCQPASNYGAMKLASEGAICAATHAFLDRATLYRFPNVIGPRSTHGVIHDLVKKMRSGQNPLQVLGDGTQEKPYLHVTELVDAMLHIQRHGTQRINCVNISPADTATVRFIAEAVRDAVDPSAGIQFGSTPQGWVGDVTKYAFDTQLLTRLGWQATFSSQDAVRRAVREIAAEIQTA